VSHNATSLRAGGVLTPGRTQVDPAPIWRNIIRMIDPYDAFGYLYSQYITMTTAERCTFFAYIRWHCCG